MRPLVHLEDNLQAAAIKRSGCSEQKVTDFSFFFSLSPFNGPSAEPTHTLYNHRSILPLSSSAGGEHSTSRPKKKSLHALRHLHVRQSEIGRGCKNPVFVRRWHRRLRADDWWITSPPSPPPLQNQEPVFSKDGNRFFLTVPVKQGGRGEFHHIAMFTTQVRTGSLICPVVFCFFFFFREDGARGTAGLGTESIIVAEGRAAAPCRGANRAVCLMCSQVCALQHSSPHTAHVIYSGSAAWNAGAELLIIECLHYPRAPWFDLWY